MQYVTNANYRISRPQLFFKIGVLKKNVPKYSQENIYVGVSI